MPAGEYGESSIEWRKTAPKTYTLTNTEQYGGPPPSNSFDAEAEKLLMQRMMASQLLEQAGHATTDAERADMLPGRREPTPQEKKMWRRQLRDFFSEANDPRSDSNQGIQSLIDSGAVVYDEDGLWVNSATNLGRRKNEQIVRMADQWADRVGLWSDKGFDPSNYRPYETEQGQRKRWEEVSGTITNEEIMQMLGAGRR